MDDHYKSNSRWLSLWRILIIPRLNPPPLPQKNPTSIILNERGMLPRSFAEFASQKLHRVFSIVNESHGVVVVVVVIIMADSVPLSIRANNEAMPRRNSHIHTQKRARAGEDCQSIRARRAHEPGN